MSLAISIITGIGCILAIIAALILPVAAALLIAERLGEEYLAFPIYLIILAITVGTLLGVAYHLEA